MRQILILLLHLHIILQLHRLDHFLILTSGVVFIGPELLLVIPERLLLLVLSQLGPVSLEVGILDLLFVLLGQLGQILLLLLVVYITSVSQSV